MSDDTSPLTVEDENEKLTLVLGLTFLPTRAFQLYSL
jgi:hypothetical protein